MIKFAVRLLSVFNSDIVPRFYLVSGFYSKAKYVLLLVGVMSAGLTGCYKSSQPPTPKSGETIGGVAATPLKIQSSATPVLSANAVENTTGRNAEKKVGFKKQEK